MNENAEIVRKKFFSYFMYKMVVITIEKCKNAKVDAKPGDGELFWVKMNDVQKGS